MLSESYGRGYKKVFKLPHIFIFYLIVPAPSKLAAMALATPMYNGKYDLRRDRMREQESKE